jgi:hypothetical protein
MDWVFREFFPADPPARTAWLQLRFGNGCEIGCVATGQRLILEPSQRQVVHLALLIEDEPTIGLVMLVVSIAPTTPMAIMVIEPSMPAFQPFVA